MKSMNRWMPSVLAGAILIAGCDRAPTAVPLFAEPATNVSPTAADRVVEESLVDFDGVFFSFACSADGEPLDSHDGELVRMQGKVYEKYTTRRDAMGGYHITLQRMPVGLRGIGETSGEEFRAIERQHATYNQMLAGATGAWRAELKLTGKETGRVFWLVTSGNYRLTADGDVVVERDKQTVVCRK
jgi:hypothetical protein